MNEEVTLKGKYSDFIGIYENVCSSEFCQDIIKTFDHYQNINAVYCEDEQFSTSVAGRFDWAINLADMSCQFNRMAERDLNDIILDCFEEYVHIFGHLKQQKFYTTIQKVQKTPAGGGYHVWHDENTSIAHCHRSMVWMLYLNDSFEGGETEFLYYKRRIQPKQGTLLIWPAGLTHAHRGGLVLSGTKYVVTGWFNVSE